MTELSIVAKNYSTDKGIFLYDGSPEDLGSHGQSARHGYTEFYDYYFSQFKTKRPVILEVGVAEGGSIRMINDYYHGNCEIYCLDINPDCQNIESFGSNIHFYVCDQSNPDSLRDFLSVLDRNNIRFDFIIDDGSHVPEDVMITFNYLYKYVKYKGFYIIEDLHTTYMPDYNADIEHDEYSPIAFFTKFTNYHIFDKETNDRLHNDIKTSILFTNKNTYSNNVNDGINAMTLLIYFKDEQV